MPSAMQLVSIPTPILLSTREEMIRFELIHLNGVVCSENAHTLSMRDTIDMLNIVICFHFVTFTSKRRVLFKRKRITFIAIKMERMENVLSVAKMSHFYAKSSFKLVKGFRASCALRLFGANRDDRNRFTTTFTTTKKKMKKGRREEDWESEIQPWLSQFKSVCFWLNSHVHRKWWVDSRAEHLKQNNAMLSYV